MNDFLFIASKEFGIPTPTLLMPKDKVDSSNRINLSGYDSAVKRYLSTRESYPIKGNKVTHKAFLPH